MARFGRHGSAEGIETVRAWKCGRHRSMETRKCGGRRSVESMEVWKA